METEVTPIDPRGSSPRRDEVLPLDATHHAHDAIATDRPRPTAGDRLGRFTLLELLGEGGMGIVFSAYDEQLDRRVAIKLMHAQLELLDTPSDTFMLREAQAMAKLSHPNIVAVYEVGSSRGRTFMAMEFIRGTSLATWSRAAPRTWQEVVRVMLQAARGLAAAHAAGLVHGDFKPANLLVGDDGMVKVVDFGLARADAGAAAPASTTLEEGDQMASRVLGTPAYMAPEQHIGGRASAASDQFSFCVTLYEMLFGSRPFVGDSMPALTMSVIRGVVRPPPQAPGMPSAVWQVIQRGLLVDPARRFPSMTALATELKRTLAPRRSPWRIGGAVVATFAVAAAIGGLVIYRDDPCRNADDLEFWTAKAASEVQSGLLATHTPYAAGTWERVEPRLDAYAQELGELRHGGCVAHTGGRMSSRLFDLRTACLDQREAAFVALTRLFRAADEGIVRNAATAAAALPSPAACADVKTLEDGEHPIDPAIVEQVEAAGRELGEALAYELAGDFRRGLELVDGLARSAPPHAPLRAQIGLRRGSLLSEAGRHAEAESALGGALELAIGSGEDLTAAAIAIKRGFVRGARLQRPRDVLVEEATVAGLVERVAALRDGPLHRSDHLNNLGIAHAELGDARAARQFFERSLAIRRDLLGDQHPQVVYAQANLGVALMRGQDLVAAAMWLRRALGGAEHSLGPDHPHVALVAINLGDVLRLLGRYDEAAVPLERALQSQTALLGPDSADLQYVLVTRGTLELDRWDNAAAVADFTRVLALLATRAEQDAGAAVGAHMSLGIAYGGQRAFDSARAQLEQALVLAEKSFGGGELRVADVLEAFGWMHMRANEPEQALTVLRRAQVIRLARLAPGDAELAYSAHKIGEALTALDQLPEAQLELEQARQILVAAVAVESVSVAMVERSLGELHLKRGDMVAARQAFERSIAVFVALSEPDLHDLAFARFGLARAIVGDAPADAVTAAELALASLRRRGPPFVVKAAEVEAWLAARRAGG